MKILIIYATVEGQTRKICKVLQNSAKSNEHKVSLIDANGPLMSPLGFDAVIIASSIHYDQFHDSVEHYVHEHSKLLNNIIGTFVSVSLTAAYDETEGWKELEQITKDFLSRTGWHPTFVAHLAGALRYSKYNFFKKFIMRNIAKNNQAQTDVSEDYEYTDWKEVQQILTNIEQAISEKNKA